MDNQRKGKQKDSPGTDSKQVTWRKFRLLDRDEQKDVPGVCSWRMNVGMVYKFDGKWISFRHDKSNFTLGELANTGILETLSKLLDEHSLSTDLGERKSKRVRFLCDNENPCKIAHTT